jgi:hypothetical protein
MSNDNKKSFNEKPHVCAGYQDIPFTRFIPSPPLPLVLRRVPGTTAIEATIRYETVLLTGEQVGKFWKMVEQVRKDLPHSLQEK